MLVPLDRTALVAIALTLWAACGKDQPRRVAVDAGPAVVATPDAAVARVPRAPEYVQLEKIVVLEPVFGSIVGPAPDEAALRALVLAELSPHAALIGEAAAGPAGSRLRRATLRVETGVDAEPPAGKKEGRIGAAVALRLDWTDDREQPRLEGKVLSQLPIAPGDARRIPELARTAFRRTVGDAVGDLVGKQRVRGGDDAAVLAGLDNGDPDVVILALGEVGERGLSGAFDRVVALLQSKDEAVRDAAIGALVALRDRRAIGPLTAMAEFQDLELLRRVIEAIGAIGGKDAHDYLVFVESGHEVPVIQELAREARERLERREGKYE